MDNSENSMISLDKFAFKEVLGGDPARKSIFLLLDGADDKKAVMLCNKQAFEEDGEKIAPWLANAKLSLTVKNDKYGNYEMFIPPECNPLKTTLIYPANEFDIERYRRQNAHLIYETAADYGSITLPFIEESKYKDNLKWVYNFLEKKSEVERIVFENEDKVNGFLLAPDLKWNGKNMDEMYFLAIANCRNLRSVRDLTPNELPLLENIRNCAEFIKEKYGISRSRLKFYFHYQPTFYHLHVHIVHMNYEAPGLGCTSILLDNVIDNLKLFPDYYAKATLPFIRKENDALYQKFLEAGRVD